jgi:hypothetical protein
MNAIDKFRMDKSAFSIVSLDDPPDDVAYWQTRSPQERLEALELLRQIMYGYDPATARLQRFFEIAEYPPR